MKGRTFLVSVELKNNNDKKESDALYPIAVSKTGNPDEYNDIFEDLVRMPQIPLRVSLKNPDIKFNRNGVGVNTFIISNPSGKPAIFVGIRMLEESEDLKSSYSDNYAALLPGECKEIIVTVESTSRKSIPGQLNFKVSGLNVPAQIIKIKIDKQ